MNIYVDIDETICYVKGDKNIARDYSDALPIEENIEAINSFYEEGHTIVY